MFLKVKSSIIQIKILSNNKHYPFNTYTDLNNKLKQIIGTQEFYYSYLWFLSKEPQLALGLSYCGFGIHLPTFLFGCTDSPIRNCSINMLTEIFKWKVSWRLESRLEGVYYHLRVLHTRNMF